MEESHLSLGEAARQLGVSERTARRWIKSGKLRAYKPGRDYRIPKSAVTELLEESEVRPKVESRSSLEPTLNELLEEERRQAEREKLIDALPGWWRAAAEDPDFARRFEAAKHSPERASHLFAEERAELERSSARVVELKARGATAAELQSARRDRKQAGARFTAATFLSVDVWRGQDVSDKRAVDYVAEVAGNQRALLAGEFFADETESTDAEAG